MKGPSEILTLLVEKGSKIRSNSTVRRLSQGGRAFFTRHWLLWFVTFLLVAVTLAVAAQREFDENRLAHRWDDWQLPTALAVGAMVVFGLAVPGKRLGRSNQDPPAVSWQRTLPLFLSGLFIAVASSPWFRQNTMQLTGLILLLIGVGLALVALYVGQAVRQHDATAEDGKIGSRFWRSSGLSWEWLVLLLIVSVGAGLRLYRLHEIPGELTLDQISKFWDIRDLLLGNKAPIFFEANQGREGLFFYLAALVSRFAGLNYFTIKLTSVLIGIATIPAIYIVGKEIGGREVGFLAAFLLAVGKWHILLSRLGYRVVLVPLFVILVIYFLARGLRRGHLLDYGLTGVMLGLGMYSYKSFPFTLPAAVSCAAVYALRRKNRALLAAGVLVMLILAFMVFIPMAVYSLESWDNYVYRENLQVRFLREHYAGSELTATEGYLINMRKVALMFNSIADPIEIYNVRHERFFGPVSAVMLILGLGYVLGWIAEGYHAILVIFLLWLMQPVALSMFAPHESANSLRAAATIGPGLLIAALSVPVLWRSMTRLAGERLRPVELAVYQGGELEEPNAPKVVRKLSLKPALVINLILIPVLIVALGIELKENYESVFHIYPSEQRFGGYPLARNIAEEIRDWIGVAPVFVRYSPDGIDIGLVKVYLTSWGLGQVWDPDNPDAPGGYQVNALALDEPPLSRQDLPVAVFILYPWDEARDLGTLQQRYPSHLVLRRYRPDGELAYLVFVGHD